MKNQVKKFSQYIRESDEFGMDSDNANSNSPQIRDNVFVSGFANDGDDIINSYAGYGSIVAIRNGNFIVTFESIFDAAGNSDSAPEGISFNDSDIVSGGNRVWAVIKNSMQFE
jgi:hypothetical protein